MLNPGQLMTVQPNLAGANPETFGFGYGSYDQGLQFIRKLGELNLELAPINANGANTGGDSNRTKDLSGTVRYSYAKDSFVGMSYYNGVNTGNDGSARVSAVDLHLVHYLENGRVEAGLVQSYSLGASILGVAVEGLLPMQKGIDLVESICWVDSANTFQLVAGSNITVDEIGKNLWMSNLRFNSSNTTTGTLTLETQLRVQYI